MKKIILLITTLSLAMLLKAQNNEYAMIRYNYYWGGYYTNTYYTKDGKEKLNNAGVMGYTATSVKEKDKSVKSKTTCDKNGNVISYEGFNKKGMLVNSYQCEYNSDNLLVSQTSKDGKGNEKQKLILNYDQLKNTIEETYYKKGEERARTVSKYDSTRILESYFYEKGQKDFSKKWLYAYYPDKTKKSSVIYDAKGKVLYTWNYECKPEGELQSRHKDTTEVCKKVEYDSTGNKTITLRRFNEKGKTYKVVSVYDKNDKLLQYFTYNTKDHLSYSYKYIAGTQNIGESVSYIKGKETYRYVYTYDSNDNLISTYGYRKGTLVNHSEYNYNEQNLVTSYIWYDKDNRLYQTTTYDYKYF